MNKSIYLSLIVIIFAFVGYGCKEKRTAPTIPALELSTSSVSIAERAKPKYHHLG